jgi:ATP-binding cassette, subfamily B, bacterial
LGAIMSRLDNDVAQLQQFIAQTTGTIVRNGITVVVSVTAIVFLNWQVGSLLIICFPVFFIPAKLLERKAESFTLRLMQKVAKLTAFTGDHLSMGAVFLVKGFGRYTSEADNFRSYSDDVRRTNVQLVAISALFSLFIAIMGFAAYMSVYGIGGSEAARGAVSVGSVVALGAYAQSLYSPVLALSGVSGGVAGAKVAFSRVFEVLDADLSMAPAGEEVTAALPAPAPAPGELPPARRVELVDVSFRFPDVAAVTLPSLMGDLPAAEGDSDRWILRDVNLDLRPGQVTAMVGPSGQGKSTLCGVIAGLLPPTRGRVLIGGQELPPQSAERVDRRIGYVAQDAFLFNASIRANLSYGRPDASMDTIREAAQIAQISELIESLPSEYDTVVGERGYRFSGGEKQRLALARMLVADPEILILDEATSQIDRETEGRILRSVADRFRSKILLIVSHRDSVLEVANRVIRLDNARIVVEDWPVSIQRSS